MMISKHKIDVKNVTCQTWWDMKHHCQKSVEKTYEGVLGLSRFPKDNYTLHQKAQATLDSCYVYLLPHNSRLAFSALVLSTSIGRMNTSSIHVPSPNTNQQNALYDHSLSICILGTLVSFWLRHWRYVKFLSCCPEGQNIWLSETFGLRFRALLFSRASNDLDIEFWTTVPHFPSHGKVQLYFRTEKTFHWLLPWPFSLHPRSHPFTGVYVQAVFQVWYKPVIFFVSIVTV